MAIVLVALSFFRKHPDAPPGLLFLAGWFLVGLLPVLPLAGHAFRYYLVLSLPALILLLLRTTMSVIPRMKNSRKAYMGVIITLLCINIASAYVTFAQADDRGFDVPTVEGSNNLSRKGAIVNLVQKYLREKHPTLAKGSCLVFDWIPTGAFCRNAGPRIWYRDTTLMVYEIQDIVRDSTGIRARQRGGAPIDSAKLVLMEFHGDYLRETTGPR